MKKGAKKIAALGVLLAAASIVFLIESLIPPLLPIAPYVKIGLANCFVLFVLISIATITYALFSYINRDVMPGWTSLLVSVWFVGGSVLLACGIIGEYVGKMYKEVKRRPHYFVEKEVGERCSNTRMNSSSLTGDNASNLPSE